MCVAFAVRLKAADTLQECVVVLPLKLNSTLAWCWLMCKFDLNCFWFMVIMALGRPNDLTDKCTNCCKNWFNFIASNCDDDILAIMVYLDIHLRCVGQVANFNSSIIGEHKKLSTFIEQINQWQRTEYECPLEMA